MIKRRVLQVATFLCALMALVLGTVKVMTWLLLYAQAKGITPPGGLNTVIFMTGGTNISPVWLGLTFAALALGLALILQRSGKAR